MKSIWAFLFVCVIATAGELQDDLKARRARLLDSLQKQFGPAVMLIVRSAPEQVYSRDVEFEYRQDSNLYYLTAMDQADTTVVLMPGNTTRKEILFVKPKNAAREHWTGKVLTIEKAAEHTGIETVYANTELEPFLDSVLSGDAYRPRRPGDLPSAPPKDLEVFLGAIRSGTAKVALPLDVRARLGAPPTNAMEFANQMRERFAGFTVVDGSRAIYALRQVKTSYERKLLEQSAAISNDAHLAGMRTTKPGVYEYQVKATMEGVYRDRGAFGWGYPSIIGSGPNATILHYSKASRRMDSGELLLVDAAANYQYYTVDITRTYPVSGRFSPEQRDIYRIVYKAQEEAMKLARPGARLRDLHARTIEVIKEGLLQLGLISDTNGAQYHTWYTHGSTHYIGIDVHDVGDQEVPPAPGHAFTIEPGIYIQETALDTLPNTPENAAFKVKVKPAFEKYKNIGVRIEDSFLLTGAGLVQLSKPVPRTIEEIEAFLKK
ncbi:MAG: aminopeptidase P N-terminal domain-containing protein [Acidobacteria bacterium]|nr:aminopeptidase P N-terminal domain-containing protein [Acidobacteriota bacterium]